MSAAETGGGEDVGNSLKWSGMYLFPDLRGKQSIVLEYNVNCKFFVDAIYVSGSSLLFSSLHRICQVFFFPLHLLR